MTLIVLMVNLPSKLCEKNGGNIEKRSDKRFNLIITKMYFKTEPTLRR